MNREYPISTIKYVVLHDGTARSAPRRERRDHLDLGLTLRVKLNAHFAQESVGRLAIRLHFLQQCDFGINRVHCGTALGFFSLVEPTK